MSRVGSEGKTVLLVRDSNRGRPRTKSSHEGKVTNVANCSFQSYCVNKGGQELLIVASVTTPFKAFPKLSFNCSNCPVKVSVERSRRQFWRFWNCLTTAKSGK